jgi:hypothetical protein
MCAEFARQRQIERCFTESVVLRRVVEREREREREGNRERETDTEIERERERESECERD